MRFRIAIEHGGAGLEENGERDPGLPVRQGSVGDGEATGPLQVRGESPKAEGEAENGEGRKQSGGGDGGTLVSDPLAADARAILKAELNNHPASSL